MKIKVTLTMLLISSLILGGFAYAEYASTRVSFNVPTTNAFTISMPDAYAGEYPITGQTEVTATATDDISFNFTGTGSERVYPCRSNSGSWDLCQDSTYGNTIDPIFRIDNTGNNPYTLTMYANETIPTDFNIELNATTDNGSGESDDCGSTIATPTNITENAQVLVSAFPVTDCFVNVSLWGYHEGTQPATEYTTNLITNSSI